MFILACNETVQMCYNMRKILVIVKTLIKVIQWSVPIALIFMGTIDMFKAVTKADDQKVVQDATKSFIRRLISGVIVFLVPFLVRLVLNFVDQNIISTDGQGTSWISCWNNVDKSSSTYFQGCNNIYSRKSDDDCTTTTYCKKGTLKNGICVLNRTKPTTNSSENNNCKYACGNDSISYKETSSGGATICECHYETSCK